MLIEEILFETRQYTPDEAREIGDCVVVAIAKVTGLSWDEVWQAAQPVFRRTGINLGGVDHIMKALGWDCGETYWPILGVKDTQPMTVRQAQAYLQELDPNMRLLCSIMVRGMMHEIAFVDGQFHNVLGAWKARIRLASVCKRLSD